MEGLKFEFQATWNFNEPANQDFSHVSVNVSLPSNVVLWDYWVGFTIFYVGYDILSIVSDLRVKVFGVWEGFLNLNFAGELLNFENLADFVSLGRPSQGQDSLRYLLRFLVVAVRLWVDRALIRVHRAFLLFKYIYLTV